MGHRVLDHTADTGVEADAPTLVGLIAELATGMFQLMAIAEGSSGKEEVVRVEAETAEDLVVDTLAELLYRSERDDVVLTGIEVSGHGEHGVEVRAQAVPLGSAVVEGPPIKAVTYHGLVVERRGDDWYGRVYFDV